MLGKKIDILVTGANGQLGSYLVAGLKRLAVCDGKCKFINNVVGVDKYNVDLTSPNKVHNIFDDRHIDYVVHCAASTDTAAIEKDPTNHFAANVLASRHIARECAKRKIKMIFISTDYVLSENSYLVGKEQMEFPVNQYGLQKLLAEKEVQLEFANRPKDLLVLRASWMFGNSSKSFVEKFLANLAKSNSPYVDVASDAYGIPTHVELVMQCIVNSIKNKAYGVANCQPWCKPTTRASWARLIKQEFSKEVANAIVNKTCFNNIDPSCFKKVFDHLGKIDVKWTTSKEMNLGMAHPGYVDGWIGIDAKLQKEVSKDINCSWEYWTQLYVKSNFVQLFKSYYETYARCYNEELMQYNINNYGKSLQQIQEEEMSKLEKCVANEAVHKHDRTKMLTVQKLIDYLNTQDPNACVLAWEPNSCAYIEQLPELPSLDICTVAEDKASTIESLKHWYKDADDAESKIDQEVKLSYRYAKDNDIVIRFN